MKILAFLAGDAEGLGRFLALSGLGPQDLRERVNDPLLLAAVIDFVLGDDKLVTAFSKDEGIDPRTIHQARQALPGAAPDV